ncbi:hypothetical protein PAXRUDRAFT_825477 [Paxillus rubicundulus Ve08.2h10]|uniref:Uncharacterized protein n=1 Tax=Paxillus rubicundulus Ve08.2h10 TaxID=930991 RepID=A0A0D0EAX2_9AGAM|nr:hypothetical protein PAXRUDRAFT_825477 [Paxillus rubicundulus Ve08.2h10]
MTSPGMNERFLTFDADTYYRAYLQVGAKKNELIISTASTTTTGRPGSRGHLLSMYPHHL